MRKATYTFRHDPLRKEDVEYQEAINQLDKAIELDGNDYVAYSHRGLAKYELKDYTGAIKDFTKAMELEPNDYVSLYRKRFAECDLEELNKTKEE